MTSRQLPPLPAPRGRAPRHSSDSWSPRSGASVVRGGRRRWPRRALAVFVALVLLVVLLVVGLVGYARVRFDAIRKIAVAGLVAPQRGKPFDVLLVVSAPAPSPATTSRDGTRRASTALAVAVARVAPGSPEIRVLEIPVDLRAKVPGSLGAGPKVVELGASLEGGPRMLVEIIERDFHLPVSYYAALDVQGVSSIVDAEGGVALDFAYPLRDASSGLDVTSTGCQMLRGDQAVDLLEADHLYYFDSGRWRYDGRGQLGVAQRQAALLRAVAGGLGATSTNPLELVRVMGAASSGLSIGRNLPEDELLDLARRLRGAGSRGVVVTVLPAALAGTGGVSSPWDPVPCAP